MRIYLDPKLESIDSIYTLKLFFEGSKEIAKETGIEVLPIESSGGYHQVEEIYETDHVYDPVKDFVETYLELREEIKPNVVKYVTNRLYSAKGHKEVLDAMNELLSVNAPFNIAGVFKGKYLTEIWFDSLTTTDPTSLVRKLHKALYHLLLLIDLRTFINTLIIPIKDEVEVNYSVGIIAGFDLNDYEEF